MKRAILFLAYITTLVLATRGQTGATNMPPTPPRQPEATQRALNELQAMQERVMDLTPDQVINLNSVFLDKNIALDSLRDHPSGDPKADGQCRNKIWHDADVRIYSLLWDTQQVQYVMWKQERRIKSLEKQQQDAKQQQEAKNATQPQASPQSPSGQPH